MCLGNIAKYFMVDNMKETGLNGYAYDVHKYLMKMINIK